jgi:hypothetical protein
MVTFFFVFSVIRRALRSFEIDDVDAPASSVAWRTQRSANDSFASYSTIAMHVRRRHRNTMFESKFSDRDSRRRRRAFGYIYVWALEVATLTGDRPRLY